MTDLLLPLVPQFGALLVFVITFLSCLALPVPSSLAMLTAGAFAGVGDLSLVAVCSAAWGGAVLGDQLGYWMGRRGGRLMDRLTRQRRSKRLAEQAKAALAKNGWSAVFLTRWLLSPLGPWVNFAAGAASLRWARFASASALGEGVWVAGYVGLGWGFAAQVEWLAQVMGAVSGAVAAAALAGLALYALVRARG
jgi:membrane-associated protein